MVPEIKVSPKSGVVKEGRDKVEEPEAGSPIAGFVLVQSTEVKFVPVKGKAGITDCSHKVSSGIGTSKTGVGLITKMAATGEETPPQALLNTTWNSYPF